MIYMNSSFEISPSWSRSNSSIIACSSSSLRFSPSSRATRFIFFSEILPLWSSSNNWKAFLISSSGSLVAYRSATTDKKKKERKKLLRKSNLLVSDNVKRTNLQKLLIIHTASVGRVHIYRKTKLNSSKEDGGDHHGNCVLPCTIFITSGFLTSNPKARMRTFSSWRSMEPVLFASNNSKASRSSCLWSSLNSGLAYMETWVINTFLFSKSFPKKILYLLTLHSRQHFWNRGLVSCDIGQCAGRREGSQF